MLENAKNFIKKFKDKNECCPSCTNIEACRAYDQSEKDKPNSESYKWSQECCEKCADATCTQHPLYVIMMSQKSKFKDKEDIFAYYHEEALHTFLNF